MKIIYPYNEILPRYKAHDIYVVHSCQAFARAGCQVTLLNGSSRQDIKNHYFTSCPTTLHIKKLPIIRKNNIFGFSWNLPFFLSCQSYLKKKHPHVVLLSVLKQGRYHIARKIQNIRYVYEVHQLHFAPEEKEMLAQFDLITTTTAALKDILKSPPYSLSVPIEVIPLAVENSPLESCSHYLPLKLFYVGQLYEEQGVKLLLKALEQINHIHLYVVGGARKEIQELENIARSNRVFDKVTFLGKKPPSSLSSFVKQAHVFVAPFSDQGRMPYVAHTKLYEYATWGRPIIAPNLPSVHEHFVDNEGALLFEPNNIDSLASKIKQLQNPSFWNQQMHFIQRYRDQFSWHRRTENYLKLLRTIQ